jgi:hypothetical protein
MNRTDFYLTLIAFFSFHAVARADDIYLKTGFVLRNVRLIDTTGAVVNIEMNKRMIAVGLVDIVRVEKRETVRGEISIYELYSKSSNEEFTRNQLQEDEARKAGSKSEDRLPLGKPEDSTMVPPRPILGMGVTMSLVQSNYDDLKGVMDLSGTSFQFGLYADLELSRHVSLETGFSLPLGDGPVNNYAAVNWDFGRVSKNGNSPLLYASLGIEWARFSAMRGEKSGVDVESASSGVRASLGVYFSGRLRQGASLELSVFVAPTHSTTFERASYSLNLSSIAVGVKL